MAVGRGLGLKGRIEEEEFSEFGVAEGEGEVGFEVLEGDGAGVGV